MGILDIQQLGEHPEDAHSWEHGAGHRRAFPLCCGAEAGFACWTGSAAGAAGDSESPPER